MKKDVVSLVTGGAGFIGSHVVDELLKAGHKVVVLDDLSGGIIENINSSAVFVEGSILNCKVISEIWDKYTPDYVFHLAAYAAEGLSHFIRKFNYSNNLLGSVNLLNAAIKSGSVKCFVFTSSIAVYGRNQVPMTEETVPHPEDPYGIAKYAFEQDLRCAHEMFGMDYAILRPHNVYGIRQNIGDKYRNVVGIFMNQIMQNQPMTLFGDGSQTRAFTHVSDVAPAITAVAMNQECYNEVYNVGADEPCSVRKLAELVADAFDKPLHIETLEARNEVEHAYASHDKLWNALGHKPTQGLFEGIKEMAAWAKSTGPRKSQEFLNIEIEKKLPASWKQSI